MNDERSSDQPHWLPEQRGFERTQTPLPDDAAFVDNQFMIWAGHHPAYQTNLVTNILAETSIDPDERHRDTPLAKKWDEHLATLAHDPTYDEQSLEGDPFEKVFTSARELASSSPEKLEVITRIERLYKRRQDASDARQQYEAPLPKDLRSLIDKIVNQE